MVHYENMVQYENMVWYENMVRYENMVQYKNMISTCLVVMIQIQPSPVINRKCLQTFSEQTRYMEDAWYLHKPAEVMWMSYG